MTPERRIAAMSSDVATGRRIKGRDGFIVIGGQTISLLRSGER